MAAELERTLQPCPKCGTLVFHLEKHLKKAHDPIKTAERKRKERLELSITLAQKNFKIMEKARQEFLLTKIQCTLCSAQINISLIADHCYRHHNSSLPADMRALYGLAETKNIFKSSKEREDYWRKAMGGPEKGDDIFDRGMTVQGGAYGLGKNRKH